MKLFYFLTLITLLTTSLFATSYKIVNVPRNDTLNIRVDSKDLNPIANVLSSENIKSNAFSRSSSCEMPIGVRNIK